MTYIRGVCKGFVIYVCIYVSVFGFLVFSATPVRCWSAWSEPCLQESSLWHTHSPLLAGLGSASPLCPCLSGSLSVSCVSLCMCINVCCARSCPTLCDPVDCSPPGSSVHEASGQEYWSGLPFPSPGDLPYSGIEPVSPMFPAMAGGFFTTEPPGKSLKYKYLLYICVCINV